MPLVSKTFSQIITFTRASAGSFFDSSGVLQSATTNAPRLDFNPSTLAPLGLLIEESRTNSIRNNTMQGAVAGTPGTLPTNWSIGGVTTGLTISVVGTGTQNGISYIDIRFNGTAGAALNPNIVFDTSTAIAAANGQSWSWSAYVSLAGGSLANVTNIIAVQSMFDSVPTLLGTLFGSAFVPTNATLSTQRQTFATTLNQATTAFVRPQLQFSVANGAAIDITLRIGLPQLEQGAFATSVIPTTTTAVTRAADVASVNTLSPWYNAAAGTIYAEGVTNRPYTSTTGGQMAQMSDGTANNRMWIAQGNTTANTATNSVVTTNTVLVADLQYGPTPSANLVNKSAFAYATNDFAGCSNGGAVQTDTSGAVPSVTSLYLGISATLSSASNWNGYLRRVTYYPRRLSNAELQTLTT